MDSKKKRIFALHRVLLGSRQTGFLVSQLQPDPRSGSQVTKDKLSIGAKQLTNKKKDILTFKPTDEYIDYQTNSKQIKNIIKFYDQGCSVGRAATVQVTICPKSSDPFYIVTYYLNWVTTS